MRGTGGPPYRGAGYGYTAPESGGLLAMAAAWAAGFVVLAVTSYLQVTYVYETLGSTERLESFGGRLLVIHLPNAVCVALGAWASSRAHREPFRDLPVRHAFAVFTVPVLVQVLNIGIRWERVSLEGVLMSCAVVVAGAVTGYAVDRIREGER
ncbi:hypothetical protein ACFXKG_39140 [Streptomyces sp. NPDC059255]|uniref:hypothetical protein n=1 Tax=Streptomyces sp. NPDC059255 TaxID=3346793 RepID=UPI0036BB8044